jgi:hypothetical protein
MPRPPWRPAQLVAGGLLGIFLAQALPAALRTAGQRLTDATRYAHESALATAARVFGSDEALSLEAIRSTLVPGEPYLLIDSGSPETGERMWVRYALAPHPVVFIGQMNDRVKLLRLPHESEHWVVISYDPGDAPDLVARRQLVADLRQQHGR